VRERTRLGDCIGMTSESVDHIVIEAGSAGRAVAALLSENRRHSVLVLEADGRDSNPGIQIPIGFSKTSFNERLSWCFSTQPSPLNAPETLSRKHVS
jgi:choline dehydrogenase